MRKPPSLFVFALLLMFSAPVYSADYQKARDAIEKKDYALALRELAPLAEKGDPRAQLDLGRLYRYGRGVKIEPQIAMKWYHEAANQGYADAQVALGHVYSTGSIVEKDHKQAVKWYRKAAKQGNDDAQYALGQAHLYGEERGVPLDYLQAEEWFLKAANQGHVNAQSSLGNMYSGGGALVWPFRGGPTKYGKVSLDFFKAVKWYKKVIDHGYLGISAAYELGVMYLKGRGIRRNDVQAYKWLLIHANWREERRMIHFSIRFRDDLKKRLTAAQIAEGQKLAKIWIEKHKD